MINIKIIVVGKTKENWIKQGEEHYLKLLKKYVDCHLIFVKEEKIDQNKNEKLIKEKEKQRILKYWEKDGVKIALDVLGEKFSSGEFASFFQNNLNQGKNKFIFIIGGALGLSEDIKKLCQLRLSFSPMTFTHEMIRLLLLEQIYRAFSIIRGTKYHK